MMTEDNRSLCRYKIDTIVDLSSWRHTSIIKLTMLRQKPTIIPVRKRTNNNTKNQYTNGFITIIDECTDEDFKALKIKLKKVNPLTNEQVLKTAYNYKIAK